MNDSPRRALIASALLCAASLSCRSEPTPPAPTRYAYEISFDDGRTRSYSGGKGSFYAYAAGPGPDDNWSANYDVGDSLQAFQFLAPSTCPTPEVLSGPDAGLRWSVPLLRHRELEGSGVAGDSSTFAIDSVAPGRVWGHFALRVVPLVLGVGTRATIVGTFDLPQTVGSDGHHC